MAFTLEQEMITILANCVETSQLKADKHLKLDQDGYLTMETFSRESWGIRFRNEGISSRKRTYLTEMSDVLGRNFAAMVERAETEKKQYNPESPKTKNMVVEEINLQVAHFNSLNKILKHYKEQVVATVSLTADGGESLKAIQQCETILAGAIAGWIAQMQGHKLHTKGVFPVVFQSTDTRSAGTLFSAYVHQLIAEGEELKRNNKRDPLGSNENISTMVFDKEVTGLYERAALNGERPKGSVLNVLQFSSPRPIKKPPAVPSSPSHSSTASLSSSASSSSSMPSAPVGNPPPYAYVSARSSSSSLTTVTEEDERDNPYHIDSSTLYEKPSIKRN